MFNRVVVQSLIFTPLLLVFAQDAFSELIPCEACCKTEGTGATAKNLCNDFTTFNPVGHADNDSNYRTRDLKTGQAIDLAAIHDALKNNHGLSDKKREAQSGTDGTPPKSHTVGEDLKTIKDKNASGADITAATDRINKHPETMVLAREICEKAYQNQFPETCRLGACEVLVEGQNTKGSCFPGGTDSVKSNEVSARIGQEKEGKNLITAVFCKFEGTPCKCSIEDKKLSFVGIDQSSEYDLINMFAE